MQILIETKLEQITRNIVKNLLPILKNYSGDDLEVTRQVDDINIHLTILHVDENIKLRLFGETTNNNLDITIITNKNSFEQTMYELLYSRLTNVIRHELEHYQQLAQTDIMPDYDVAQFDNINELEKYLSNPQEVEAFISEIYFAAKRQKNTFNEIFKERIKPFIQMMLDAKQSPVEIKKTFANIKQKWFQAAKKRFPNVKLT